MAFTYDTTTNRGKVRLLVFDRDSASYTFTDAEIDAFLSLSSNDVFLAASYACRDMAARGTRNFSAITLGAFSQSGSQPRDWNELARSYEEQAYGRAGIDYIDMMGSDVFGYSELEVLKALRGESD